MKSEILQIIMAAIGTLGFSIYFRVSEKNVAASTIGGAIGWSIYLLMFHFSKELFISNFAAAIVVYIYSEIMARLLKAPSNVFLIPGIIPLIPGGALYYTMRGVVDGNTQMFLSKGSDTVVVTFGIAGGIVVGTIIVIYVMKFKNLIKKKHINK